MTGILEEFERHSRAQASASIVPTSTADAQGFVNWSRARPRRHVYSDGFAPGASRAVALQVSS